MPSIDKILNLLWPPIRLSTRGHDTTVSGGGMAMVSEGGESIDMDTEEDASHTTEPLEVTLVHNMTARCC